LIPVTSVGFTGTSAATAAAAGSGRLKPAAARSALVA